jgi:WD40 repeat protein
VQTRLDSWFRISLSADGTLAASAGSDFAVSVWEVATGKELLKLPPHKDHVYGAAFSPDGRYLASGGRSNPIHLWELATGQQVFTLPAQDYLFAFAPDGRTLVSGGGSYDGAIPLWDLATGKERRSLGRHDRNLSALAFSRDGRLLATASGCGRSSIGDSLAKQRETRSEGPQLGLVILQKKEPFLAIEGFARLSVAGKDSSWRSLRERRRLSQAQKPPAVRCAGRMCLLGCGSVPRSAGRSSRLSRPRR